MKRNFFFLKDTVSGKFYWIIEYIENFVELDGASVYHNRTNAKKMLQQIVTKWKWVESAVDDWIADENSAKYGKTMKQLVNQRKDLPNWGIEIVEVEISVP